MIERYIGPEAQFARWYYQEHPEFSKNLTDIIVNTLGKVIDHEQMQQSVECCMKRLRAISNGDEAFGVVVVDYGYCYAAIYSNEGISFVTRQNGFVEAETWPYEVSEQLGYQDIDFANESEKLDALMQWIYDPQDKLELFRDVFRKILKRIIQETADRLGEAKNKKILVSLPALPAKVKADWKSVLHSIIKEKCIIIVDNHSACVRNAPNVTSFIFSNYYANNQYPSTIVEAISQNEDDTPHCDTFFYDMRNESSTRPLQAVIRQAFSTALEMNSNAKENISSNKLVPMQQNALPIVVGRIAGFTAFLRSHSASFRHSLFSCIDTDELASERIHELQSLFRPGEALSALYICSQLCNQTDSSSISLMDMATVFTLLENRRFFQKTNLITKKKKVSLGAIDELPLDIESIAQIPANYSSVGWRCFADTAGLFDYHALGSDKTVFADIIPVLQSIVSHYDYCTTEDVASDLNYMWMGSTDEPSALLTAKIYLLLRNDPSFRIIRSLEPIHKPVYETEQYPATPNMIDKFSEYKHYSSTPQISRPNAFQRTSNDRGQDSLPDRKIGARLHSAINREQLDSARESCRSTDSNFQNGQSRGQHDRIDIRNQHNKDKHTPKPISKSRKKSQIKTTVASQSGSIHPPCAEKVIKNDSDISVGMAVGSKSFGNGIIVSISLDRRYCNVEFTSGIKRFSIQDAFDRGHLKKK